MKKNKIFVSIGLQLLVCFVLVFNKANAQGSPTIDSVGVEYTSNELSVFARSFAWNIEWNNRQLGQIQGDSLFIFDVFWMDCTKYPMHNYENHEITEDSVYAPIDVLIRFYYDTNIVNYDPEDGFDCEFNSSFTLLDSLYLTVADQESLNTEEKEELVFEVYPNPANDLLEISGKLAEIKEVRVYDASGKEVLRQPANAGNHLIVDVSSLENGVYILHCMGDGGIFNKRFVKLSQ